MPKTLMNLEMRGTEIWQRSKEADALIASVYLGRRVECMDMIVQANYAHALAAAMTHGWDELWTFFKAFEEKPPKDPAAVLRELYQRLAVIERRRVAALHYVGIDADKKDLPNPRF